MKKKALVLAVCMAFTAPTISIAQAMPDDLFGLALGEIQSASYLHEPFKAIIPILFTNIEESSQLSVKLAPDSIFKRIGAEKLPILNNLRFQIKKKNNKPVIFVSSSQPISIPFLNFILEIVDAEGNKTYQDYTTLLDPVNYQGNRISRTVSADEQEPLDIFDEFTEFETQPITTPGVSKSKFDYKINEWDDDAASKEAALEVQKIKANLLIAAHASPRLSKGKTTKYIVKAGDSLSKITQELSTGEISLKKMMQGIHANNPHAFVKNNINRLKRGAILSIPSLQQLNKGITNQPEISNTVSNNKQQSNTDISSTDQVLTQKSYRVKQGDTLSKIVRKIGYKGSSFTKMLNTLHKNNPHAFSRNNINKLKAGAVLQLPSLGNLSTGDDQIATKQTVKKTTLKTVEKKSQPKNADEFSAKTYKVKKGDTLAQVVKEIGYEGVSFTKMMKAIYAVNPQAFLQSNITILKEGAVIQLPPLSEIDEIVDTATANITDATITNNPKLVDAKALDKKLKKINKNKVTIKNIEKNIRDLRVKLARSSENLTSSTEAMENIAAVDNPKRTNGYTVKEGDTLAHIVKKIGHKSISFTKMMKAIYMNNKEAFLKNNITRLKEGAVIYVPSLSEMIGTASVSVSPRQIIAEHKKNQRATNMLKKELRESRRDLAKAQSKSFELELTALEKASLGEAPVVTQISNKKETKEVYLENELPIINKKVVADLPLLGIERKGYAIPETASAMIKEAVISHAKSMSNKELVYSIMALFLGLLLIRYRKQLYGYVAISYDYPKYYPANKSTAKSAEEREKEIIKYHETLIELDEDKDLEINKDFLDECETLAEQIYNNKDYDEEACDKISNEALDIIKAEIDNDTLTEVDLDATPKNSKSNEKFEKIGLDLFGKIDDLEEDSANQETIKNADESNFDEVRFDSLTDNNVIDKTPKTDWEKLLDSADKQLSEMSLNKEQESQVSETESEETMYETKPEIPANLSNGTFENIEMPDFNSVEAQNTSEEAADGEGADKDIEENNSLAFTQKDQTNKFEEAVIDENSFYDEYCRNQLLFDENEELAPA